MWVLAISNMSVNVDLLPSYWEWITGYLAQNWRFWNQASKNCAKLAWKETLCNNRFSQQCAPFNRWIWSHGQNLGVTATLSAPLLFPEQLQAACREVMDVIYRKAWTVTPPVFFYLSAYPLNKKFCRPDVVFLCVGLRAVELCKVVYNCVKPFEILLWNRNSFFPLLQGENKGITLVWFFEYQVKQPALFAC